MRLSGTQDLYYWSHYPCFLIGSPICNTGFVHITKTRLVKYIENFTTENWKFSDKNSDRFHISAENIDCWGGSNEYPQSMFLSRNTKNNVYPVNPSFTI